MVPELTAALREARDPERWAALLAEVRSQAQVQKARIERLEACVASGILPAGVHRLMADRIEEAISGLDALCAAHVVARVAGGLHELPIEMLDHLAADPPAAHAPPRIALGPAMQAATELLGWLGDVNRNCRSMGFPFDGLEELAAEAFTWLDGAVALVDAAAPLSLATVEQCHAHLMRLHDRFLLLLEQFVLAD